MFCDVNAEVGKATETELQKQYGADNVSFLQCDATNAHQIKGEGQTMLFSRFFFLRRSDQSYLKRCQSCQGYDML